MEAIFGLLKINAMYPIWGETVHMTHFGIYNGLGTFWFFCAVWIYALKYHESATEVRFMLGSEITSLLSQDSSEVEFNTVK